jgi:RNA polymerase sigma factor (TIGR02999 family)
MMTSEGRKVEVTQLLEQARTGDQQALNELVPMVYDELRRIASASLHSAGSQQTMLTTDLVHEAFLKLTGSRNVTWENRLHFFNLAAASMRQILVDHARARKAKKRWGTQTRVTLNEALPIHDRTLEHIAELDEGLREFEAVDARACRIVELRFFTGLTIEEIAGLLNISSRTVKRDWEYAKAWLHRWLVEDK